jgi:CRISPR-associated protein (TIGR03984 family)
MIEGLCTSLPIDNLTSDSVLRDWLNAQAKEHKLTYMLAHAEDGVIWGHFNEDSLATADQFFPQLPSLRLLTLQQCRIFGLSGEVLLWHTEQEWIARFTKNCTDVEHIEEKQILWGTRRENEQDGFTLLADGQQGLRHAVPLTGIRFDKEEKKRPIRLIVHHYIDYDDDGVAYIGLSRLVNLIQEPIKES